MFPDKRKKPAASQVKVEPLAHGAKGTSRGTASGPIASTADWYKSAKESPKMSRRYGDFDNPPVATRPTIMIIMLDATTDIDAVIIWIIVGIRTGIGKPDPAILLGAVLLQIC